MTRRTIWLMALLVAALLSAAGWWFATHFERVPVTKHQPPGAEAQRNQYLALERFMARMGRPLATASDVSALDHVAPGGVLILDRNRWTLMTKPRLAHLFRWVGQGGYLIVIPESTGIPDPVLTSLHVHWGKPAPCSCKKTGFTPSGTASKLPQPISAQIPGDGGTLHIAPQSVNLKAGNIAPQWRVADNSGGDWLLDYRYGLGNITLAANLDLILSSGSIGRFDHAEFFWKLLQHYQPSGPVTLVTRLYIPDLFDWLKQSAWAAMLSAALLIVLWLWRIMPRFGPVQPDLPPSRRELREHLNAVGRFIWRSEGCARWLEAARASFHERLALRHPAVSALPTQEQAEVLARLTSLPRPAILSALSGAGDTASEFTAALRMLQKLKHQL